MTKERLVFEVADGVTTPREGELMSLGIMVDELVSRTARHMSLTPSYSIHRVFYLK